MEDVQFVGSQDSSRQKAVKSKDPHDIKFLVHIKTKGRTYVFSAMTRSDHMMWLNGLNAFLQIKALYKHYISI